MKENVRWANCVQQWCKLVILFSLKSDVYIQATNKQTFCTIGTALHFPYYPH